MKSSFKIIFLLAMLMAVALPLSGGEYLPSEASDAETEQQTSLHGKSRFLAGVSDSGAVATCAMDPTVCHRYGNSRPDCCNNKCVNLLTDGLNCGRCGKKCSYKNICCEGKCVNPNTSNEHCGKCGHKCSKGSSCEYGMCSYA